jgi:hypothetical protein
MRCGWIDADHRKLLRVGVFRKNDQVRGCNDQALPPYEASDWKYNPITDSQTTYLLSDLQDSPDAFVADDGRQFRTQRIKAAGNKDVAEIDGRELDADENLADTRLLGLRKLAILKAANGVTIVSEHN